MFSQCLSPFPLVPTGSGLYPSLGCWCWAPQLARLLSASLQAFSFQKQGGLHACVFSLSLPLSLFWVFLPFSTDMEHTSQFQLQLMEDQKSQSCLGSCQSHGHEWLQVTTAKGTFAVTGRADSKRICRSALVMEDLVAVFKVVQTPRRPNSFDLPCLLWTRAFKSGLWAFSETICRNSQASFFLSDEKFHSVATNKSLSPHQFMFYKFGLSFVY